MVFPIDRSGPSGIASSTSDRRLKPERDQSVAVLVFTNQSGEAGQDYFSDGLTEDITNALGRFKNLTVLAYGAVLPYKGKQVATGGHRPRPQCPVPGRRQRAQDGRSRSRHRPAERRRRWHAALGGPLRRRFDGYLRGPGAHRAADRRNAGFEPANIALQHSLRKPTDNLDAYDLVLRGRAVGGEATRSGNRKAREMFERATRLAPSYADAYAELAATFSREPIMAGRNSRKKTSMPRSNSRKRPSRWTRNAFAPMAFLRAPSSSRPTTTEPSPNQIGRSRSIRATPRFMRRARRSCFGWVESTRRSPPARPPTA